MNASIELRAKPACLGAGAVWGLFWIPLRALEGVGLHGVWTTAVYFLVPACCLIPVVIWRCDHARRGGLSFQITVLAIGVALTLYSASIIYTDVTRAMPLFYLMPIWSAVLARIVLGEAITPIRIAAMAMAVLGMLVMFGLGYEFPIPSSAGDWMGLGAGVFLAITMVRLSIHENYSAVDLTIGFFIWGLILSAGVALIFAPSSIPTLSQTLPVMPLLLAFIVVLVLPGTYASLWGPKFLNPGTVGLLFMTEIVVGAISAAIWAGKPFGHREAAGVLLIAGASLLEPITALFKLRTA